MFENIRPALLPDAAEGLLQTNYREDLDIWLCRWFSIQDSGHFKKCYNQIFDEAKATGYHYWLVDIRGRGRATQEDYDWYFATFLPNKLAELQGHFFLAYLVTPSHYTYIQQTETLTRFEEAERTSDLKTRFFQSEQDAIDWLVVSRQK
jgi:hypothetical protein